MDKLKFVKDYLSPLIVSALGNVVDVRYTFTGSFEIVTVIWDNGESVHEENINVSCDSLLALTKDVVGRLLR